MKATIEEGGRGESEGRSSRMKESVDWQMGSPSRHRERGWEFRRWRDPSTLGLRRRMCLLTFFYTETLFLLPCHGWLITLPVGGKASVSTMGREGETENHTTNLQSPPHPLPLPLPSLASQALLHRPLSTNRRGFQMITQDECCRSPVTDRLQKCKLNLLRKRKGRWGEEKKKGQEIFGNACSFLTYSRRVNELRQPLSR